MNQDSLLHRIVNSLKEKFSALSPRRKQVIRLFAIVSTILFIFVGFTTAMMSGNSTEEDSSHENKSDPKSKIVKVSDIVTSSKGMSDEELWFNKLHEENETIRRENEAVKSQNKILEDKIDVLDSIFKASIKNDGKMNPSEKGLDNGKESREERRGVTGELSPKSFPPQNSGDFHSNPFSLNEMEEGEMQSKVRKKRIYHLGSGGVTRISSRKSDSYIPAGTHAKVALLSGVVAMTAVESQGNPLPIVLRVIDDGNLPRGFKSRIKDAIMIGACYGDISSERVQCRMETMSWVESDGTTVEKKVEGWLLGEDGRPGLRGKVVDRSGDVARESMIAGILSTMTSFLQMEATRSVYPVSPFGQTNALSGGDALKAAAAGGAGNALDKLAEFSIKRAEQMQPVIVVSSGRVADVVFKSGVSILPYEESELKMVSGQDNSQNDLETSNS